MEEKRLFEKYRPTSFDEVIGQDKAIQDIKQILARGWGGRAWWISGNSGIGKTTLARIIARHNPKDPFVHEFDSADELTMSVYRDYFRPFSHGMRTVMPEAYIVNEAHGLKRSIVRLFMGILERLPHNSFGPYNVSSSLVFRIF